jgi:hypothetical protein
MGYVDRRAFYHENHLEDYEYVYCRPFPSHLQQVEQWNTSRLIVFINAHMRVRLKAMAIRSKWRLDIQNDPQPDR